ncbi:MAG: 3'-5' exonuclease [Chloroflexota bacterium]
MIHLQHATFREPYAMIDAVQSDLKNGLDCMILTTCTYMLQSTIKQLRLHGIPFHNPYRPAQGGWNPLAAGKTAQRILQFIKRCPKYSSEAEALLHLWTAAQLADWTRDLGASCFAARGKKQELLDLAKDKERKNELVRAEDYLSPACLTWTDAADFAAYERAILGNNRRSYEFPLALARRDIKLLTETPRVVIGTVHSVKGAEAASVYLAPDLSMAGYDQWSRRGTPQHDDVRRVFYVAMTRARETLTILGPGSNLAVEGM